MKCPHCNISFHPAWAYDGLYRNGHETVWYTRICTCPSCYNDIVYMSEGNPVSLDRIPSHNLEWKAVFPKSTGRDPVPVEVPSNIAKDYEEACSVLEISPKASAALSRRCLQTMLRANGYKAKDLYMEIDQLLNESDPKKAIPESLRDTVDGIRHFGNFSAHPITDMTSLQIIDVEPHEAEWCLDILSEAFEHFYVRPAKSKARKAELDIKLKSAGKHPSK